MISKITVLSLSAALLCLSSVSCSSTGGTGPIGQVLNIPGQILNGATNPIPLINKLKIPNIPLPF